MLTFSTVVLCYPGEALRYLNLNRLASGVDYYGHGRYPFYVEPAVIVTVTDGCSLTAPGGTVQGEISVPKPVAIGNELTREPFHWDQRVFSLVLRLPSTSTHAAPPAPGVPLPADTSPIDAMCRATGGM